MVMQRSMRSKKANLFHSQGQFWVAKKLMDTRSKSYLSSPEFRESGRVKAWKNKAVEVPLNNAIRKQMFSGYGEMESVLPGVLKATFERGGKEGLATLIGELTKHPGWVRRRGYDNQFFAAIDIVDKLEKRVNVMVKATATIDSLASIKSGRDREIAANATDAYNHGLVPYFFCFDQLKSEINKSGWRKFIIPEK